MDLALIFLTAAILQKSAALPVDQYTAVATANGQPLYWISSPSAFYRDAPIAAPSSSVPSAFYRDAPIAAPSSSVPSAFYRDAPVAASSPPAPSAFYRDAPIAAQSSSLPSVFYRDAPVAAPSPPAIPTHYTGDANNNLQYPLSPPATVVAPGYSWIRAGVPATRNQEMPLAGTTSATPEFKAQNPNPEATNLSLPNFTNLYTTLPLEASKEKAKEQVMKESKEPQVTVYAPGSYIEPDYILNVFKKFFIELGGTGVFIYAPGSVFTTKSGDVSTNSSYPGSIMNSSAVEPPTPAKPISPQTSTLPMMYSKSPLEYLSEILNEKKRENAQRRNTKQEEEREEEEEAEKEGDDD